ncbi:MAG TPA: hypothetical protein VF384_09420 [Planctomycetota bacterium]
MFRAISPRVFPTYSARHLRPGADDVVRALRRRQRAVWPLRRRGADLGYVVTVARALPSRAQALARWNSSEPVFLPGILGAGLEACARDITASLRLFDRMRSGGSFRDEIGRRIGGDRELHFRGSTKDESDPREVERLHFDAGPDGTTVAHGFWTQLAWIAHGTDRSLRIRFAAGPETFDAGVPAPDLTCGWADVLAARAFPEAAAILACAPLRAWLQQLLQRPHRLSERIVYNNCPDGGAVFHHDAEPGQLGVVFSQLEGHTAWLSLGKRRLAALLAKCGHARNTAFAMAALDQCDDKALLSALNRDAEFTAVLAAHGALFVLQAGDAILLPSQGIDAVAWHSVIALGDRPSLAHSYGIFPRRSDYPLVADRDRR